MATPQSTTSQDDTSGPKKLEQITFRFCSECSNMLYPKEDEDAHKLQFTCRTCQYTEEAASTCVFRNVLNNSAGETAGVTQDVGSDPTVSELPPVVCLHCGTVISCAYCSQPATCTSLVKPEDKPDGDLGIAHFVLALADHEDADPFAEYDEELDTADGAADEGYATADSNMFGPGDQPRVAGHTSIVEWHGFFGPSSDGNTGHPSTSGHALGQSLDGHMHDGRAFWGNGAMVIHL
ncbi:RNA polymerases m/15 kd subunit [Hirsutella rhossiliensis]|uniref:RNA polymerases m/15 kd subunit domain-containing protein n=1 Tax=Hirsutella rhossiliensis TaxID=111463 RepID=A0A9P8N325_9HYPO|nr:RNA polymerases m/15 kd subunit domain-containing protein [Hirsutella rhossiliensis]KAH0965985.1 RNA polymerases m/15 kd subunit domain-containing protein [Hirsutella rhossiliensis]